MTIEKRDAYLRIPVTLKNGSDAQSALRIKQAMERKYGRTISWAELVRRALTELAAAEGIECQ